MIKNCSTRMTKQFHSTKVDSKLSIWSPPAYLVGKHSELAIRSKAGVCQLGQRSCFCHCGRKKGSKMLTSCSNEVLMRFSIFDNGVNFSKEGQWEKMSWKNFLQKVSFRLKSWGWKNLGGKIGRCSCCLNLKLVPSSNKCWETVFELVLIES